ncbi:hypothetical protein APY31_14060 [Listeria monocytogenes]|nr:hypothetical protein APY31_14060 [Listeria monocytogenes]
MDDTDKRVHKYIEKHDLIRSDDKLLVAVSGGPDSLALLHFLWNSNLVPKEAISVAHLNHHLRENAANEQTSSKLLREPGHSFLHRRSRRKKSS